MKCWKAFGVDLMIDCEDTRATMLMAVFVAEAVFCARISQEASLRFAGFEFPSEGWKSVMEDLQAQFCRQVEEMG